MHEDCRYQPGTFVGRTDKALHGAVLPVGDRRYYREQLLSRGIGTPKSCTGVAGTNPVPSSVVPTWIYTGWYYRQLPTGTTGATIWLHLLITEWLPPFRRYRPGCHVGTTDSGIHGPVLPLVPPVLPVRQVKCPTRGFQDVKNMGRLGGCNYGFVQVYK